MLAGLHTELRRAYAANGRLFELHADLLHQCDLDCRHCYLDDKARKLPTTDFWRDVIDQASALGVVSLTMSGGEIFLRKDVLELIAHARARKLFVHLKTHGGHIDAQLAHRLAELSVSSVSLSYYASDPHVHDHITRRVGSHARTRAALEHLVRAGVQTIASCSVMESNRHEWRKVVQDCEALGVLPRLDGQLHVAHSGDPFPKRLGLPMHALVELEAYALEQRGGSWAPPSAQHVRYAEQKNCAAGHLALYVSPEGDVTPCVTWPMPLGNLARGDTLAGIWASSPALEAIRASRRGDRILCRQCEVRSDCDFCAGQAWMETGDPLAAIQNKCRMTRAKTLARAAALGLPEPPLPIGLRADQALEQSARGVHDVLVQLRVPDRAGRSG